MPSFFWHMHQGFTHTILLGLSIIAFLHSVLLIGQKPSYSHFFYLGISIAVGLLAKYSFIIFLIPLLISALTIKSYRDNLSSSKIILTFIVILFVAGPHFQWMYLNYADILAQINNKLNITNVNSGVSYSKLLFSSIGFLFPLLLVIFIGLIQKRKKIKSSSLAKSDSIILLDRFFLISVIVIFLLGLFFFIPHVKVRWLHPLLMIFPYWSFYYISHQGLFSNVVRKIFYSLIIFLTLLVIFIRVFQTTLGPDFGIYGRLNIPITEGLKRIPADLISNKRLLTNDNFLGTHLLANFNDNQIIIGDYKFNSDKNFDSKCLVLWDNDNKEDFYDPLPNIKTSKFGEVFFNHDLRKYKLVYKLTSQC